MVATGLGTGRKVRFPVALSTSRADLSKKFSDAHARLQIHIEHAKATIFILDNTIVAKRFCNNMVVATGLGTG